MLIVPAYNEEKNIKRTIDSIIKFEKVKLDYIVINDGSKDATEMVLKENNFKYISLPYNMGIGVAVQTGYKYAYENNYDIAVQFDGDGQHDIEYIDQLIKPILRDEADIVIGSRYIDTTSEFKSTFFRQIGIKVISALIKGLTQKSIKDVTSGYRAVNKSLIQIFSKAYPQEYPEPITNYAMLKRHYRVKEVGVNMYQRKIGKSSIRSLKSIYYMFNVFMSILCFNFKEYREEKHDIN